MAALNQFWHEYKAQLRGYIAKRVANQDCVDDILQDVFLKAHKSLHTLKSRGSIAAWLFRIAANAISDYYRTQKNHEPLPDELPTPEPQHNPHAELAACLKPLIADLPETYRTALQLSELEDIPQKDVANQLGISLSGAKSRIQRGRAKLRQRLLDCCEIELQQGQIVDYQPRKQDCC